MPAVAGHAQFAKAPPPLALTENRKLVDTGPRRSAPETQVAILFDRYAHLTSLLAAAPKRRGGRRQPAVS